MRVLLAYLVYSVKVQLPLEKCDTLKSFTFGFNAKQAHPE